MEPGWVFNLEVDGSVSWKRTKNFNISNEGIVRIEAFLQEKHLISLVFLLLWALKSACTERAFEIQSYLDTWIANIGQGDRFMLFNSSKL